jgi:two-component system chemotaxis response regulator CheB
MPESALQYVTVDYTLPVMEIPLLLNRLAREPVFGKGGNQVDKHIPDSSNEESEFIEQDIESFQTAQESNQRSVLTCPDCGGVLWEIRDGRLMRYRCHTGHIYNAENLLASHDNELEKAFWTAIRTLVEKAAVSNRLAIKAKEQGHNEMEMYYLAVAREAEDQARLIRESWFGMRGDKSTGVTPGEQANQDVTRSTDD